MSPVKTRYNSQSAINDGPTRRQVAVLFNLQRTPVLVETVHCAQVCLPWRLGLTGSSSFEGN